MSRLSLASSELGAQANRGGVFFILAPPMDTQHPMPSFDTHATFRKK